MARLSVLAALTLTACGAGYAQGTTDTGDSGLGTSIVLHTAESGEWACNWDTRAERCLRWPEGEVPVRFLAPSATLEERGDFTRAELAERSQEQIDAWNAALAAVGVHHTRLVFDGWMDERCDELLLQQGGLPEEADGNILLCVASPEGWESVYPDEERTLARTRVALDTSVGVVGAMVIWGPQSFGGDGETFDAVTLHELGHAMGLMHNEKVDENEEDAMYEEINGLQDLPTEHDRAGLAEGLYPEVLSPS